MENQDSFGELKLPKLIQDDEQDSKGTIIQHSDWGLVERVKQALGIKLFEKLQQSFLGRVIEIASKIGDIKFSGKIFHFLMQRRLKTKGSSLWFVVDSQPIRFSLREFFLTTGNLLD